MNGIPASACAQHERETASEDLLATMSSDALLVAADALRAWGAESDSERIEMWVAQRTTEQQLAPYEPIF